MSDPTETVKNPKRDFLGGDTKWFTCPEWYRDIRARLNYELKEPVYLLIDSILTDDLDKVRRTLKYVMETYPNVKTFAPHSHEGDHPQSTALIVAARHARNTAILELLLKPPHAHYVGGIDDADGHGCTALSYLIQMQNVGGVNAIINAAKTNGIDLFRVPTKRGEHTQDYIIDAARVGNSCILEILHNAGADLNRIGRPENNRDTPYTALTEACCYARVACVAYLLKAGAHRVVEGKVAPMSYQAVRNERLDNNPSAVMEILECLIAYGEDVTKYYEVGTPPQSIQLATVAMRVLREKRGCRPNQDVSNQTFVFLKLLLDRCKARWDSRTEGNEERFQAYKQGWKDKLYDRYHGGPVPEERMAKLERDLERRRGKAFAVMRAENCKSALEELKETNEHDAYAKSGEKYRAI